MVHTFIPPVLTEEDLIAAKNRYVSGPQHLLTVLDVLFDPAGSDTVSCVYRSFFWLAFSGVPQKDVFNLTAGNLDFKSMSVRVGDFAFPIYRESISDLQKAADAESFLVENPIYTVRSIRKRCESDRLLRGFCVYDREKMASVIKRSRPAYEAVFGQKMQLNYRSVLHSGIFYRAYELERFGTPVSFKDVVALHSENEALDTEPLNIRQRENALERKLKRGYYIWKQLYTGT